MSFDFLRDAFKSLNEASFEINDKEALQDLDDFRKASEETEETTVSVIDPEADKEEELADSYIGKAICECPVCHSYVFKNKEDIRYEEGEDLCNTDEECPYCCEIGGFKIVGQVCEFKPGEAEEEEEEIEAETEPTEEVDVKAEEEVVDEALNEKFGDFRLFKEIKDLIKNVSENPDPDDVYNYYFEKEDFSLLIGWVSKLDYEYMPNDTLRHPSNPKLGLYVIFEPGKVSKGFNETMMDIDNRLEPTYTFFVPRAERIDSVLKEIFKDMRAYANVDEALNEGDSGWLGIKGAEFKWRGTQSDPQVAYKGHLINYWDICDAMGDYMEERGLKVDKIEDIHKYMEENPDDVEGFMDDVIFAETEATNESITPKKLDPDKFTADEKNDEQVLVEEDDRNAPKNLDPDKFTADEKNKEQNIVEDAVVNSKRILSGFDGTDEDLSKFISECLGEGCWEELSFDDNDPDSLIEIYKDGELIGKFQIVDDKLYNVDTNECFSPKKEGILGMGLAGLAAGAGFAAGKKAFEGKEECADGECEEEKKDEGILGTLATAGLAGAAAGAASSFVNNKLNSGVSKDDELAEDVQVNVTDDNGTETVVTDGETVMSNDAVEVKATEDSIVVTPKESAPAEAEAEAEEKAPEEGEEIIAPIEPADLEPAEGEAEEAPAEAEEKPEEETEESEEKAEEEVPAEEEEKEEEAKPEEEEADVAVEEIDNESFDRIGTNYLTNLYENVEDFKTINAYINENNSLVLEGVINFKSGKSATTSFIFEAKDITASGKARFVGMNESICKGKRAFTLTGTLKDGQYIAESLSYNYTAKTPSGRSVKVNGTVNK